VYKRLEKAETAEKVSQVVVTGMKKYETLFVRPMVDDDVKRLLEIRIRRISAYDIERNREEIDEIVAKLAEVKKKLANMNRTTIHYVESLLERYGDEYPRRTQITQIETVDKKAVARANVKLAYDPDTGFFGSSVRGDLFRMSVSEYDLVLAIAADGTYRVMPPVDKGFFGSRLLYCHPFDPEAGAEFTVVYRDGKRMAFAKRIRIEKFIRNKEYRLVKDEKGRIDLLLQEGETGIAKLTYVAMKRQRLKGSEYDLSQLDFTAPTSRGTRLAPKAVARVGFQLAKPGKEARAPQPDAEEPGPETARAKPATPKKAPATKGKQSGRKSGQKSGKKPGKKKTKSKRAGGRSGSGGGGQAELF
jgi:topoisomerase-4 subunit A